jgi:hypothetical protein
LVLATQIVIATMTANRRHFQEAIEMLSPADHGWRFAMITRRLDLPQWARIGRRLLNSRGLPGQLCRCPIVLGEGDIGGVVG